MTPETTNADRSKRHRSSARWAAVLVTALFLALATSASAATNPAANPGTNIGVGPLPGACANAPRGSICVHAMVRALDRAHAVLGIGPYLLPTDFYSLTGSDQLLILCNLDRLAYGLPAVAGLSPALNAVAASGVTSDADPDPSALLGNLSTFGWSSNWAGGYGNALEAYYAWMYYDGWGGKRTSNLDCTSVAASGCWGHREDVLAFPEGHGRPDRLRDHAGLDGADELDKLQLQLGQRPGRRRRLDQRTDRSSPELTAPGRRVAAGVCTQRRRELTSAHVPAGGSARRRSPPPPQAARRTSSKAQRSPRSLEPGPDCARRGSRPRRRAGR